METFPKIPSSWENQKLFEKWEKLKIVRNVANAAIEVKRSTKEIGSSLEANIEIYLGKEYFDLVKGIDLSEYFITSKAVAKPIVKDDKQNINVEEKKERIIDEIDSLKIILSYHRRSLDTLRSLSRYKFYLDQPRFNNK